MARATSAILRGLLLPSLLACTLALRAPPAPRTLVLRRLRAGSSHGDFYDRSDEALSFWARHGADEMLDGGNPAIIAVIWVLAWCVGFGSIMALTYLLAFEAFGRDLLRPIAVRFSTVPLEAALAVLGVLYSVLLGSTLSAAMTRQEAQLHAVGAELAAAELLEGGLNDLDKPHIPPTAFGGALAALAAHVRRLETSIEIFCVDPSKVKARAYVDPLGECAAILAAAGMPPTPLGARADLERLHMCRAARRAAEAGPRFPSGHWVVLKTLGLFCSVTVALVSALSAAASETSDGGYHGAALVGVTSMALALSETIVGDVADRNSGMYTAARSFLPGVRRLRERLEGKALEATLPPDDQTSAHGLYRGLAAGDRGPYGGPPPAPPSEATGAGAEAAWLEARDPTTGMPFFTNAATGETTWDRPEGADVRPGPPARVGALHKPALALSTSFVK